MPSKYRAVRTKVDGVTFASKREAARYSELCLLEKAGKIRALQFQPRFMLKAQRNNELTLLSGERIGEYVGDFRYFDCERDCLVVEDVKGYMTPLAKWKIRHAEIQHGITVEIIK